MSAVITMCLTILFWLIVAFGGITFILWVISLCKYNIDNMLKYCLMFCCSAFILNILGLFIKIY